MADQKISADPEATDLTGAYLAGIQGGTNKKFPASLVTPVTPINLAQFSCSVWNSTAQSVPANAVTKLTNLSSVDWDPSSMWNTGTQRCTPVRAGLYDISAKATIEQLDDGARMVVFLFKNGVNYAMLGRGTSGASGQPSGFGGTLLVPMNGTTDYLEMSVFHANGADTNILGLAADFPRYTTFSVSYMGPTP
jgi:hypothetical protein